MSSIENKDKPTSIDKAIDKTDIQILFVLYRKEMNNVLNSMKIKDISKELSDSIKATYGTYVNRLTKLLEMNLINLGIKDSKAKTYFITQEGIDYIDNNVCDKINIYEEGEE